MQPVHALAAAVAAAASAAASAAVFLERYSSLLSSSELAGFQALRSNYEVNYWLNQAEQQQQQQHATSSHQDRGQQHHHVNGSGRNKAASKTAANRRLAFMYQLEQQGEYFSESAMRAREPLVWHEYIGAAQQVTR
jgi:ATP/maltotriose-dependent transcriptional regulator MalT